MPLSFPLSLAQFADGLVLSGMTFDLDEALTTTSETGGGEDLSAVRGVQLWGGGFVLAPGPAVSQEAMRAKIDLCRRPGARFVVAHPYMRAPQADPAGVMFAGAILTVSARLNSRELRIAGGPSGSVLSGGDHLSVSFGPNGARRAYFRTVTGATFSASGLATIEVVPDIPFGVAVGNSVNVLTPTLKAKIRPGTYDGPTLQPNKIAGSSSFQWKQVLD